MGSRPIRLLGMGQKNTHEHPVAAPSLAKFAYRCSAAQAFGRAGVTSADIGVTEICDSFTFTLLAALESIGFFDKGEPGPAALAGALDLGRRLPCNTRGRLMSYAHFGAISGLFHVMEAVRQMRGEAQARQVQDAELALVHGDSGILSAHCSLVLGKG